MSKSNKCALVKRKYEQFEQLITPCVDSLYTQAMRLTNNAQDAQDLVQDTFERALKSFSTFHPGTNFSAWINRIERNLYFNQYAKEKRAPKRANDKTGDYNDWDIYEASNHAPSGLVSAEQEYFEGFAPKEIIAALGTLTPDRRKVFVEAAINGKSYKQIAKEEGIKIGTVMSRLNRARTQLKHELADLCR
ncbi:sigma-70 family RNA polymerase sigma factor [Gardnerella greenwoodii]|uniref:sigma-70 family RNA polymerase sigma factor n=1 Tax=Gardnerella greenwoodii TaxID=2914925 RepID=UPI0002DC5FC1|nr:sigma-70 family RNA polymerase sigma factor [Gardnerella greenwoodii]